MGVELEVDFGECSDTLRNDLDELADGEKNFYLKHDGSLSDGGIELVTHPCSLRYHQKKFPWRKVLEAFKSANYKSHDAGNCGLHVHVSRAPLMALGGVGLRRKPGEPKNYLTSNDVTQAMDTERVVLSKLVLLQWRLWRPLFKFSRRKLDQVEDFAQPNHNAAKGYSLQRRLVRGTAPPSRYYAINTENTDTIEFRIFRGTLRYETLMASLELVDVMLDIAIEWGITRINRAKWTDVVQRAVRYPFLAEYIGRMQVDNHEGDE